MARDVLVRGAQVTTVLVRGVLDKNVQVMDAGEIIVRETAVRGHHAEHPRMTQVLVQIQAQVLNYSLR